MTFLRLWDSPGGGGGGGAQLLFPGGSTVWTEQTLAEDTLERECPHDVVGLRPHDGMMWMSNNRVPLKKFESPYGGGVSPSPVLPEIFLR